MRAVLTAAVLLFAACEEKLPVKYMICDVRGNDCNLSARFTDRPACEQHRVYGRALCYKGVPGQITCNVAAPASTVSSSYCTR